MTDKKIKFKAFMQPAFLICTTLLLLAWVGKITMFDEIIEGFIKIPIDLRKSFDEIDREKLAGYKVIDDVKITNKEVVKSLGTEDYIQWILMDTEESASSPVRYCSLFITYYGMPDRVPHVPDECYIGSGYETKGKPKHSPLDIKGFEDDIEMRVLSFSSKNADILANDPDFSRMYFFKVNNDFACTRTGVRTILGKNLLGDHSYFSKVEWEFFGKGFNGKSRPSDEHNIAASRFP